MNFQNNSLNPWFITGFSDGEAASTYSKSGNGLGLIFSIRLREDDIILLSDIHKFFGVGKIYKDRGHYSTRFVSNTKPSVYYRVSRALDLIKIIKHFDKYPPQSKKIYSYKIWREMVILKQNLGKPDCNQLNVLACKLSNCNSKSNKIKHIDN